MFRSSALPSATVLVRLAGPADGPALAEIYRPAVTDSVISFELDPPDAEEMVRRVAYTLERTPWLVCEVDGCVVGYAYAGRWRDRPAYQWSVEVSAYIREGARRMGVARTLYTSLFAVLKLQGFRSALAGITLPNDASVGVHTALGFKPVGVYHKVGYKYGAWHDTGWYEREIAPHDLSPIAPLNIHELYDTDPFRSAIEAGAPSARG